MTTHTGSLVHLAATRRLDPSSVLADVVRVGLQVRTDDDRWLNVYDVHRDDLTASVEYDLTDERTGEWHRARMPALGYVIARRPAF